MHLRTLALALLLPVAAHAQQQPDPRLAGPMIQALQAQVAFQQALLRVQEADAEAQKKTLWQWLIDAKAAGEKK